MGVHRTCGEPSEIKKNTHPKLLPLSFVGRTCAVRDIPSYGLCVIMACKVVVAGCPSRPLALCVIMACKVAMAGCPSRPREKCRASCAEALVSAPSGRDQRGKQLLRKRGTFGTYRRNCTPPRFGRGRCSKSREPRPYCWGFLSFRFVSLAPPTVRHCGQGGERYVNPSHALERHCMSGARLGEERQRPEGAWEGGNASQVVH